MSKAIVLLVISIAISALLRIFGYIIFIYDYDYLLIAIPILIVVMGGLILKHIYLHSKLIFFITIVSFMAIGSIAYIGLLFSDILPTYKKTKEPKTQRVFVAQSYQNMFNRGYVQLYEVHGLLLKKIKGEYYSGEFSADEPYTYISDDGKQIIVSFFFMGPVFSVPMKKSNE